MSEEGDKTAAVGDDSQQQEQKQEDEQQQQDAPSAEAESTPTPSDNNAEAAAASDAQAADKAPESEPAAASDGPPADDQAAVEQAAEADPGPADSGKVAEDAAVSAAATAASATEGGETAAPTSPPPQIVVDTVPDRDPDSPTETQAPAEAQEKPKEEETPKEEPTDSKPDEKPAAEAAASESSKEKAEDEAKEKPEEAKTGAEGTNVVSDPAAKSTDDSKAESSPSIPAERDFNGKYRQIECENAEAFFQAVGLPWILRKMVTKFSPTMDVKQEGENSFHIKMLLPIKAKEYKFTVGEEFEDSGFGWKKESSKVTSSWDGNKLVLLTEPKDEKSKSKPVMQTREMDGNRMTVQFEVGDVVCKRLFEKKK